MDKSIEERLRSLVDKFTLLRTEKGSVDFDKEWEELISLIPKEEREKAGKIFREAMASRRNELGSRRMKDIFGNITGVLNMSYIAREYFNKDKSWISQKMNGNIVNGKIASFTNEEKEILRSALDDIRNRLSETISSI